MAAAALLALTAATLAFAERAAPAEPTPPTADRRRPSPQQPQRRPRSPSSTSTRSKASSAAKCAAPPTRIWAGSSTCWSTAAARCAPRSSISAVFSASAAARSRWTGARCIFRRRASPGTPITLELTRDQVKAAPEYQDGKPVVVLGALGKLEPLPSNSQQLLETYPAGGTITPLIGDQSGCAQRRRSPAPAAAADAAGRPEAASRRCVRRARSLRGLDWFIFFVADVQTGFGPFVSVYLTAQKWTQVDIGLVLSGGRLRLADRPDAGRRAGRCRALRAAGRRHRGRRDLRQRAGLCGAADLSRWCSSAAVLHALASCVLGPAIAAISLGLVGHAAIGERLGRNARFASVGNGLAAAAMGACGYLLSARAVFIVTVLLLGAGAARAAHDLAERDRSRARPRRACRGGAPSKPPTKRGRTDAQSAAADLRRLPLAVPSRQCGDAAADGQRR